MVLKKRVDYEFRGFQVPKIPRHPRSARRRVPFKKPAEDGQACAFELLASLAGKLLQESESSASSNASEGNHQPAISQCVIQQERQDEVKPLTEEQFKNRSYEECNLMTEVGSQKSSEKCLEIAETDCALECISANNNSDCWEKVNADVKSELFKLENKFGQHSNRLVEVPNVQEVGSSGFNGSLDNKFSLKDPLELGVNSPALVDLNSDVKSPFGGELFPNASFAGHGNDTKLGFRDDDENLKRCTEVCTKSKAFRPSQCIARQIIRKRLTSRPWRVAPKLKECEHIRSDKGIKLLSRKTKTGYNFERSQCYTLFKRSKFFDRGSVVTSDGGFSSECVSDSPKKGISRNNCDSSAKLHVSKDSHVKFSIKSFRIPELYVDVPETATVASLKRTVMEAVMTIIGGGVHVGVLVQGKKVRDDNRTLLQTGISIKENRDKLGFVLEPSSCQASAVAGDPSQCEAFQPTRSPGTLSIDSGISVAKQDPSFMTNGSSLVGINNESTFPSDTVSDKLTLDSRELVAVSAMSTEALAVVPVNQNTRRSELVQRRARRPFSASEVEALVEAVEEVGTGRWRDVKLLAFENADYRTYVDLKDKWKTLVHTAKISPQQRRGEPVPQELLDRVLAAHAYWSHYQAKHHVNHKIDSVDGVLVQPLVIM